MNIATSLGALDEALDELLDAQDDSMRYDPQRFNHPYYRSHRLAWAKIVDSDKFQATRAILILRAYIGGGFNVETGRVGFLKRTGAVRWIQTSRPDNNGNCMVTRTTNCVPMYPRPGVLEIVSTMTRVVRARTERCLYERNRDCYSAVSICDAALAIWRGRRDPMIMESDAEKAASDDLLCDTYL